MKITDAIVMKLVDTKDLKSLPGSASSVWPRAPLVIRSTKRYIKKLFNTLDIRSKINH